MQILNEDALLRASIDQVPDSSFGDDHYRAPMRALLAALNDEAGLEPAGEWAAAARMIQSLNRRRRLSALLEREPGIRAIPIPAPIFILGFPRTGTTLLHNLMASDPRNRALRLWEMREPIAPADASPQWRDEVIAATEQLVRAGYQLSPRLADIHPLRATWPDECSWLFRNAFASMVLGFAYFVPSYVDALAARDARPDYAHYRLQLQAILSQRPGAPLVLKDPCHIWNLDALLETFPDARIIHLHRRIEDVVPSFCSLCRALQEGGARPRSLAEIGAYATRMLELGMRRLLSVRAELPRDRVIDLDYRRLVADPPGAVAGLYARLGLELDAASEAAMQAWLDENRGLSGRHRYTLEMFGLEPASIRERFAAYTDFFSRELDAHVDRPS